MIDRPDDDLHPLSHKLGSMEAKLDMIIRTQSEDRDAGARYRTDIRGELKEQSERLSAVENAVSSSSAQIADMKPKVDRLNEAALKRAGAQGLATALGKGIQVFWGVLGGLLVYLISRWLGK
jgi:hypothetical protein